MRTRDERDADRATSHAAQALQPRLRQGHPAGDCVGMLRPVQRVDLSGRTDGQAPHLPGFVGQTGQAAPGSDPRARGRRGRRAVDGDFQSRYHHPRAAGGTDSRGGLRGFRLRPGRLDQRRAESPPTPTDQPPAKPPHGTTSSSRPGSSEASSVWSERSSCTRTGAKLPTDLLGLTCVRYGDATKAAEVKTVNQKLRKAIEDIGGLSRIEGLWWQFSMTERSTLEPSAVSLLRISRDRDRLLEVNGRAWQEDGTLSARYWSEAAKEMKDPAWHLLRLEGRAPPPPERTSDLRHRRDQARDRGPRRRITGPPGRTPIPPSTPGHPASTYAPTPTTSPSWTAATTRPERH